MSLLQAIVLAVVQGITEFLPISSSGHLVLVPHFFGWPDQGLAFDVATHVGTLAAVVVYFRRELVRMAVAWFGSMRGRATDDSRLAWAVLIATVPVGIVGLLANDWIEANFRSPARVAVMLTLFGVLLGLADRLGSRRRDEYSIGWWDALLIGAAQALALMPGTSRSGVTMTAALALGLTRLGAARFSFVMSVPPVALAGMLELVELLESGEPAAWTAMSVGLIVSAVTGLLCIHVFLRILERVGMLPFVTYRLLLAGVIAYVLV